MSVAGMTVSYISRALDLPRGTVSYWLRPDRLRRYLSHPPEPVRCPRCRIPPGPPADPVGYAYLLGLYLGDGHLVTTARAPVLRVFCADAWPGLIAEREDAMLAVLARKVHRVRRQGCVAVRSYSRHWPCVFPQHGPGRKHDRPIYLADWQKPIVANHPGQLLRGLFHSDGCRITNRVTSAAGKTYSYPRYTFYNESADIMALCQESLDRLGVGWRMCRRNMLSVARREAVAVLDRHVGPKW
jgi:hypothetical protein